MISRAYKYVFYKLYRFERLVWDGLPETSALCLLIAIQTLNIYSILVLVESWWGVPLFSSLSIPKVLLCTVAIGAPQYFFLLHRGRYKRVLKQFSGETSRQSIIGGLAVACYVFFSFIFLIWSVTRPHYHAGI